MNPFNFLHLGTLLSLSMFFSCTGLNLITLQNAANTNPTHEYASAAPYNKGGFFFHRNYTPGFIGLNAEGTLEAEACNHSVLYLVSWGDSSIEKAKSEGKITKVAFVDYQQFGILSGYLYHRFCSLVKGQ
ncbi:adhesin Lsa14 [Leptospira ognonensis]|nr:TRL-like family protein [Leptospira ognonensis]